MSPGLHSGLSDPWRSPPALSSTLTQGYFFEWLGIQVFNSHSHMIYGTSCHGRSDSHYIFNSLTCDLRYTMPRQRSLPILPREVKHFPMGDKRFKHVSPLTYLIYLSTKELYVLGLFKRYRYLAMKYNVSYEIWTLFMIC